MLTSTFRGVVRAGRRTSGALAMVVASLGAAPAAEDGAATLIDRLTHPDPFIADQTLAEVRKLGSEALAPLASRARSDDRELRFRAGRLFEELMENLLSELENEYRSLELDRRELGLLREREKSRAELIELRARIKAWKEEFEDFTSKVDQYLVFRALQKRRESRPASPSSKTGEEARFRTLAAAVSKIEEEIPDLEEKARALSRYYRLESIASSLEAREEVEELRRQQLAERVKEREPAVDELLEQLSALGPPAYSSVAARRAEIPVKDIVLDADLRSAVGVLYDELISKALDDLTGDDWSPREEDFDRRRYQLSLLWAVETDRQGAHADTARRSLDRHLESTLKDLEASRSPIREAAARELYRLGDRGLDALLEHADLEDVVDLGAVGSRHAFLANLLRWRIDPDTYERIGVSFGNFRELPFPARRRRVFQYARAAGHDAIPTLRAIIMDDELEESFLVKFAAAKALAAQLGDRLGYLVLKSLHPDLVMKRPEISRDLRIMQGVALVRSENYQAAIEEFLKILEEFPFDFEGNYHIAFAYLLLKNYQKAIHHFEVARRINPRDQLTLYNLACAYSLSGKKEEALEALEASVEAGFQDVEHMKKDPDLDPLRDLPGFREILRKAGEDEPRLTDPD